MTSPARTRSSEAGTLIILKAHIIGMVIFTMSGAPQSTLLATCRRNIRPARIDPIGLTWGVPTVLATCTERESRLKLIDLCT